MATQQTTQGKRQPMRDAASAGRSTQSSTAASGAAERDEVYGLVSVLYHALQGAETYGKYIEDARRGDDAELLEFFQECRTEENDRALRAKQLLALRLEEYVEDVDEDEEDEDVDDEDVDDEDDEEDEEDED